MRFEFSIPWSRVSSFKTLMGCDSDWRFGLAIFQDLTCTAIPLNFVLLAAEILATPGLRFWELCDSRFGPAKVRELAGLILME